MNRDRFEMHDLYRKFFDRVVSEAIDRKLASPDHFTIDGTLIRSWASHKSLQPIESAGVAAVEGPKHNQKKDDGDANAGVGTGDAGATRDELVDWRGVKRSNATHRSTTDPEARLARKGNGRESHLCHSGHVLMENRSGLCLNITADFADGHAERRNALRMLKHVKQRHQLVPRTLGMDKGYRAGSFLVEVEKHGTTPHAPIDAKVITGDSEESHARRRARRRMKTVGYRLSQRVRQRCEQIIGWGKTVAGLARTRFVGLVRIENAALLAGAAYNLLRMTRLATG